MGNRIPCAFLALALASVGSAQVVLGQVDDFQDGTLKNWAGGDTRVNVATGGPAGSGDRYLRINSTGGSGGGSRLATFNDTQWAGNYTSAGITSIGVDLINLGSTALEIRLVLFYFGSPNARFTSTNAFTLAVGSGWRHAQFSMSESAMTRVGGTGIFNTMMGNMGRIMLRHDVGTPSSGGTAVVGSMGIDNVRAVPEPASIAVLLAGCAVLRRRRR